MENLSSLSTDGRCGAERGEIFQKLTLEGNCSRRVRESLRREVGELLGVRKVDRRKKDFVKCYYGL